MKLHAFIAHLDKVRANGDSFEALCPAHDDRAPSLSVAEGDQGGIVVHCHAGCEPLAIVEALGLHMADLAPDSSVRPKATPATRSKAVPAPVSPEKIEQMHVTLNPKQRAYLRDKRALSDESIDRYQLGIDDRQGERRVTIPIADNVGVYRDVRRWLLPERRRPDSAKMRHWRTGYGDARLYPIDQLKQEILVLVEGELDALACISHGIEAITATSGAGTWPDELSAPFKGKKTTILMDADEAGHEGAKKRAISLCAAGAEVRVASWPEGRSKGWDITDELREHGVDSLQAVVDAAELFDADTTVPEEGAFGTSVTALPGGSENFEWGEPGPLPDALPPVEPFDYDLLPDAFRPWIKDIAERMQAPPDYPAVGAMVALAAVIGRQLGMRPKEHDHWTVVPNLWGGIIGRPGLMKTPALQEALAPLAPLEARAREKFDAAMRDYEADNMVAEAVQKNAKTELLKAVKANRDPFPIAHEALVGDDQAPHRQRYRTSDPTVEKLGELLNQNPRGLLVFRDELTGFLRMLDREGNEVYRAFFLEAWNGTGVYTFDRIGRGTVDIEAACISVLGGIQPGPISVYMSSALRGGGGDDGLVQRFQLLVWPDPPDTWTNVDRLPDAMARQHAFSIFERLDAIAPQAISAEDPEDEGDIPFLRFTPEAQVRFNTWRTELERRLREEGLPPILEAHLAKFRSLIPSLALLIHLADEAGGPVEDRALLRACAWGEYLESHARRIYAPALSPGTVAGKALGERIRRGDVGTDFSARDIYRKNWANLDKKGVEVALELLEDLEWICPIQTPTAGRTRTHYVINPKVLEQ
jgi:hypothetical protein